MRLLGVELAARRAVGVAAAGLGLVLIAFVFAAGPLLVPGIALVAIGSLTPLSVLGSVRGARVRRTLARERVTEGEPMTATLELRWPLGAGGWGRLQVHDPLSGERRVLAVRGSPLRGARRAHLRVSAAFPRRGEQRIEPPWLLAHDPFELSRARRVGEGVAQTVMVLARTEPVRWLRSAGRARLSGGEGEGRSEAFAATDLDGLRPYRPGSPASRIHWPALARGAGLVERRLHADADERPLVVLDARWRGGDPDPLDIAVRATASLVLELARGGGCAVLLPGPGRATVVDATLSAWPAVLTRLAIVGTAADTEPLRAPTLTSAAARSGPLIYVAAVSHTRLLATLEGAGRAATVFVVPDSELVDGRPRGAGGRARPLLSVAGARGFALGAPRGPGRPRGDAEAGPPAGGEGRPPAGEGALVR